jgi:8-oxo-dGTP pyrophosphatase MutT (NUDIX family)
MGNEEPIPRPAARVVVCDAVGRVLMFKARFAGRQFWLTPGGGLNPGETHEEAACRELWEETGLRVNGGELTYIWTRTHVFEFKGRLYDQQERYYLLRLDEPPAITYENWEEEERSDLLEHRWWTPDEIEASDEVFAPRRLGALLRELLANGSPLAPFDVGV